VIFKQPTGSALSYPTFTPPDSVSSAWTFFYNGVTKLQLWQNASVSWKLQLRTPMLSEMLLTNWPIFMLN